MKRLILHPILLLLALAFAPLAVIAQAPTANPPGQISYQGFLTDANGIALATNRPVNFTVIFRIYPTSTGTTNSGVKWSESQVVTVDRGYFTVLLGTGSQYNTEPWTNNLTGVFAGSDASDRYIGMTVVGQGGEIVPRLRLLASPYSFLAANAINAVNVTGANSISATNLSASIGLWSVSGGSVYRSSGNVGIGTASPSYNLDLSGNFRVANANGSFAYDGFGPGAGAVLLASFIGAANHGPQLRFTGASGGAYYDIGENDAGNFVIENQDAAALTITPGRNVGIGTSTPVAALDVNGSIALEGQIRVPGAGLGGSKAVFIHQATAANNVGGYTTQTTNPMSDNDPNAILIVTPRYGDSIGTAIDQHPIFTFWISPHWYIANSDFAAMPAGAAFNVMVVKP